MSRMIRHGRRAFFLCVIGLTCASAQYRGNASAMKPLTGIMHVDLLHADHSLFAPQDQAGERLQLERRSPLQAGLLSAALPGAGQYYNEDYWTAAAFAVVEATAWIVYLSYDSKGDSQTDLFQTYADGHWSVRQYVEWIGREFPDVSTTGIMSPTYDPARPWDSVDWEKLNQAEDIIAQKATSGLTTGFTHRLPRRPAQQYYELIGKYPQFLGGWDDGYAKTRGDILTGSVSQNFSDYSLMRGKANDYYTIAQGVSIALLANHLTSALEAAWAAARFNNRLHVQAYSMPQRIGWGPVSITSGMSVAYRF